MLFFGAFVAAARGVTRAIDLPAPLRSVLMELEIVPFIFREMNSQ